MKLILATLCTYYKMAKTLTECDYEDRLLSFYLLDKLPDELVHHYVETGLPIKVPKSKERNWYKYTNAYTRERRFYLLERLQNYQEEEMINGSESRDY